MKLHSEGFHDVYSPNIILVSKYRKTEWTGHAARMGKGQMRTRLW
jgi:hypothetical protein